MPPAPAGAAASTGPGAQGSTPASTTTAPTRGTQPTRAAGAPANIAEAAPRTTRAAGAPAAGSRPAAREGTTIAVTPAVAQVDPGVQRAYSLYQRGDWDGARADYQRVLERDATNRDALLGLAALDVRARSFETAELRYLRLLELNPRDSYALGALVALQGNVDAVQSESRIKTLIATQPEATHLYFTLGNLYSSQARWPEAQEAFFKAYSADPDNADYAFNLAVSLDQLRQRKPAAEFYRKAAALAATRPAGFDRARAESRARELER
jgi:tetratricopeptide (TPR) repeat protein